MTLDLAELKELADKATPGPWEVRSDRYDPVIVGADEAYATVYRLDDAYFIAAARSAVPALIAEVERLTAERDEASAMHAPMRVQTGSKTHGGEPEYGFICVLCRESHPCLTRRVLSRTEDGTDG